MERMITDIHVVVYNIMPLVVRLSNINSRPEESHRFLLDICCNFTFGCRPLNTLIFVGYGQQSAIEIDATLFAVIVLLNFGSYEKTANALVDELSIRIMAIIRLGRILLF